MLLKSGRLLLLVALVSSASVWTVGCNYDRGCRGGSCGSAGGYAPDAPSSTYVSPGYDSSGPAYTSPSGSGTRTAPVYEGSGSR